MMPISSSVPTRADHPLVPIRLGRYALFDELASGGMATIHLGRLIGPVGFSRTVAIKRLHRQHARDPEFVTMLLDEARLAARIHHPNVVPTLDVVATEGEVFLVMEYVAGESLAFVARLLRKKSERIPAPIAGHIVAGALHGLHAAHEAKGDHGEPLGLIHRDVSPQNILIGVDGVPRVLDFGVAKAAGRLQTTDQGRIKGKLAYMAPEQLSAMNVSRQSDVFSAGVVLWEALTGKRLFQGEDPGEIVGKVLSSSIERPSAFAPEIPKQLDAAVMKALARKPEHRFATALAMAEAIEDSAGLLPPRQVGAWLEGIAGTRLDARAAKVASVESASSITVEAASGSAFAEAVAARSPSSSSFRDSLLDREELGTGRSQVGSVVSKGPEAPKRARWLPYAIGVFIVAVPAVLLFSLRKHADAGAQAAARAPASALSALVSPSAAPPSSAPVVVLKPEASASSEPKHAAPAHKVRHYARRSRYRKPKKHTSAPKKHRSTSRDSLYSRQ